jgi:hypothetical protein
MHGGFQRILRTLRAFTRNSLTFEGEIPPHCPGLNNFHAMTEIGLPVLCIYFRTMWNLCAFLAYRSEISVSNGKKRPGPP